MEMIDLSRLEPQETLNHTSKGNQLKWKSIARSKSSFSMPRP